MAKMKTLNQKSSSYTCRVCLDKGASIPIFGTKEKDGVPDVYDKLCKCVSEKVKDIEGYPRHICQLCLISLNNAVKFIDQYKVATKILERNSLKLLNPKDEFIELNTKTSTLNTEFIALNTECKLTPLHEKHKHNVVNAKGKPKTESIPKSLLNNKSIQIKKCTGLKRTHTTTTTSRAKKRKAVDTVKAKGVTKGALESEKAIKTEAVEDETILYEFLLDDEIICSEVVVEDNTNTSEIVLKDETTHEDENVIEGDEVMIKVENIGYGDEVIEGKESSKPPKTNLTAQKTTKRKPPVKKVKPAQCKKVKPTFMPEQQQNSETVPNKKHCSGALCHLCGETFSNADKLSSHKRKIHSSGMKHECPHCQGAFHIKSQLEHHIKRVHVITPVPCPECGKIIKNRLNLVQHIGRMHKGRPKPFLVKKFECDICKKMFWCKQRLLTHTRRFHTGERPEICEVCGKGFIHIKYLTEHMFLHTGEKPYKCPICGKGHAGRSNVKVHVKHNHRLSDLDEETRERLSKLKVDYLKHMKP